MSSTTPPLLTGHTAVITGAASGIGRAIAQRYAAAGAAVALLDVDRAGVTTAAAAVAEQTGARTMAVAADVADEQDLQQARALIEAQWGTCDIVVSNAGILVLKNVLALSVPEFDRVLRINLTGAFLTARIFAQAMVDAELAGSIIFTSSLFGRRGGRGNGAYSASKFGLIGLAQSMAAELAPLGIRVNVVCPGQIDSPMLTALFQERAAGSGLSPAQERQQFAGRIPLGRLGSPTDVADTFLYLASDLSSYVTGQDITVDGGWSVG